MRRKIHATAYCGDDPHSSLAGTVFLPSCEKSYHQVGERYVLVAANIKLPYWREAIAGFMDAAGVLGVKAEVMGPDAYNPQEEVQDFEKAASGHPSGILVSPAQPQIFTSAINA